MESLADRLVEMSRDVSTTLDLEPEFISEILVDFEKAISNRFFI